MIGFGFRPSWNGFLLITGRFFWGFVFLGDRIGHDVCSASLWTLCSVQSSARTVLRACWRRARLGSSLFKPWKAPSPSILFPPAKRKNKRLRGLGKGAPRHLQTSTVLRAGPRVEMACFAADRCYPCGCTKIASAHEGKRGISDIRWPRGRLRFVTSVASINFSLII